MYLAKVYVTLKPSVLDPQGKVVKQTINNLGYNKVTDVRVSKYIEIKLEAGSQHEAEQEIETICDKILANPNTETYRYEIGTLS